MLADIAIAVRDGGRGELAAVAKAALEPAVAAAAAGAWRDQKQRRGVA